VRDRSKRWQIVINRGLLVVMAVMLVIPSAAKVAKYDLLMGRTDSRVLLARWFSEHVPEGSSLLQSGSAYGHAQMPVEGHYQVWIWHGRSQRFEKDQHGMNGEHPDWIVLQDSPLPSSTQPVVTALLAHDYVLVHQITALSNRS